MPMPDNTINHQLMWEIADGYPVSQAELATIVKKQQAFLAAGGGGGT